MNKATIETLANGAVQLRLDPLLGWQTRINPARANRPKSESTSNEISELVQSTHAWCPFCPERVLEKTPRFEDAESLGGCDDGRLRVGQALAFPNLSPFGEHHAVIVLCDAHYISAAEMPASVMQDGVRVAVLYGRRRQDQSARSRYVQLVWNYMPPSAGSLVHPHFQVMVEPQALPMQARVQAACAAHRSRTGRHYFEQLCAEEKAAGDRWVAEVGRCQILASYAPRCLHEMLIVVLGRAALQELDELDIEQLGNSIAAVARALAAAFGAESLNLVSYSAEPGCPDSTLHFRIIQRPKLRGLYTNDSGPFERMLDSWVVDSVPEETARAVKSVWRL